MYEAKAYENENESLDWCLSCFCDRDICIWCIFMANSRGNHPWKYRKSS